MAEYKNIIHSVKYNFIMNFILTSSNLLFPLITFPYVSRVLHATGNGKVNFAASVANYFLMVASLGIPTYGVKACAKVRDNRDELSKTAQEILIINLIATVLVSITYVICVLTIPKFSQDKTLFFIEGINIVLNMFGANWLYQALEKYDYIAGRSIIFKAISVVLMFLLVHQESDYHIYAATSVLAAVGSNIMNFARLHRYINFNKAGKYNFRQHLRPIFILFAQNVTISVYTNLDTVMLGFLKNDSEIGFYTASIKIRNVLLSLVNSLGNVLLPRMSFYATKNDVQNFNNLMKKAFNAVLFMAVPLCTYFVFEAKDCILFIAGSDYFGAIASMQIITIAVLFSGLSGVLGVQVLTPLNKEKYVLYSVIVGAVSDFLLNLLMIPSWGSAGAALATTIAEFLVLLVQIILGKDILKPIVNKIHFLKYIIFTFIAFIPMFLVSYIPVENSFIRLVITSLTFFGCYCVELYLNKDEFIISILNSKIAHKFIKGNE